jgi:hypothetical protein
MIQPARDNDQDIDRLYGLEPVIEPGSEAGSDAITPFVGLQCPWCVEAIEVQLDLSAGSQAYIEDCQVCCRPIRIDVQVTPEGALHAISGERADG